MPKTRLTLLPPLCATLLAGCAGHLEVHDAQGARVPGIPFRVAEVFVRTGTWTQSAKGGDCTPAAFAQTLPLPTGAQYFVAPRPAALAKTAFHIHFGATGAVTEIGLDSQPAAADTLKASADLIKIALPAAGVGAATLRASAAADGAAPKACDAGEVSVRYTPLADYMRQSGR